MNLNAKEEFYELESIINGEPFNKKTCEKYKGYNYTDGKNGLFNINYKHLVVAILRDKDNKCVASKSGVELYDDVGFFLDIYNTIEMRTKKETSEFLKSLRGERMTKNELQTKLRDFFGSMNSIEEATDADNKDVDYSIIFTTASIPNASEHFIDVEIYYLKTRDKRILITESEILMYEE